MKKLRNKKLIAAIILASISTVGCGHSKNDNNNTVAEPTITFAYDGDIYSGKPYTVTVHNASNITALHGSISKDINQTASADNDIGNVWYYTPDFDYINGLDNIENFQEEFTLSYGNGKTKKTTVTPSKNEDGISSDPLLHMQWHIKNNGVNYFGTATSPTQGMDINVLGAWYSKDSQNNNITGKDVRIGVFDYPIDLKQEDLKNQIYYPDTDNKDVNSGIELTMSNLYSYLHGSAVAGIIAAEGNNKIGVRGIAYGAKVSSFNVAVDDSNRYKELELMSDKKVVDINNASIQDTILGEDPAKTAYLTRMYKNNIPFIKSSENNFNETRTISIIGPICSYGEGLTLCKDDPYLTNKGITTDCQFSQKTSFSRYVYNITVASLDATGKKSSFSSTGSHLWISAFGGEYGYKNGTADSPAIVTTLSSFTSSELGDNDWDKNTPWRNEKNEYYTAKMNATSAATPMITGVSALILQAKPDITVPQLRYILAKTSRNDNVIPSLKYDEVTLKHVGLNKDITLEKAWQTNKAGMRFSNYYGFGLVDATAAVKLALECKNIPECTIYNDLPTEYETSNQNPCKQSEEDLSVYCEFKSFVDSNKNELNSNLMIDAVSVDLQDFKQKVDSCDFMFEHSVDYDVDELTLGNALLQIELESPEGTTGVIKPYYSNWIYNGTSKSSYYVNANNFYRENVNKNDSFKLKIYPLCPVDIEKLNKTVKVRVFGYNK